MRAENKPEHKVSEGNGPRGKVQKIAIEEVAQEFHWDGE